MPRRRKRDKRDVPQTWRSLMLALIMRTVPALRTYQVSDEDVWEDFERLKDEAVSDYERVETRRIWMPRRRSQ